MILILSCVYPIAMIAFAVAFLAEWIRCRRQIWKYLRYGFLTAGIALGLNAVAVLIPFSIADKSTINVVVGFPLLLVRILGFTMLGMYYCDLLEYPSFPFLLQRLGVGGKAYVEAAVASTKLDSTMPSAMGAPAAVSTVVSPASVPQVASMNVGRNTTERTPVPNLFHYVLSIVVVSTCAVLYTFGLFWVTAAHAPAAVGRLSGSDAHVTIASLMYVLATGALAVATAFGEEMLFRLGIQSFLAKQLAMINPSGWLAIVMTSALWTMGHAGRLEPEWVKLAQIFPIGLAFGSMARKYGVGNSTWAHLFFNVAATILSPFLSR